MGGVPGPSPSAKSMGAAIDCVAFWLAYCGIADRDAEARGLVRFEAVDDTRFFLPHLYLGDSDPRIFHIQ